MAISSKKSEITPGVQLFDFKILSLDRHLEALVQHLREVRHDTDKEGQTKSGTRAGDENPKDL